MVSYYRSMCGYKIASYCIGFCMIDCKSELLRFWTNDNACGFSFNHGNLAMEIQYSTFQCSPELPLYVQANAQEKFMRVKHAYNTLMNSDSRSRYDAGNSKSDFSYSSYGASRSTQEEEEFYGLGTYLISRACDYCFIICYN